MAVNPSGKRPWTFYLLAAFFTLFVLFLYGPMSMIYLLSFQGPMGGLTLPMEGVSLHWFKALLSQQRTGDLAGAFVRSVGLAAIVVLVTVVFTVMAGLGFRRRFTGAGPLFYMTIASLIMPGLLVGLGIGLTFQLFGWTADWYSSGLAAQLTWTLPYGLLIMFAVLGRFNKSYEEAARDLGATSWQCFCHVVLPIVLPGVIGVALFSFTLAYDEFPRTLLTAGSHNTLPLEIWSMTTNVTSPALYAVGTLTTVISLVVIGVGLCSIAMIQRRRVEGLGGRRESGSGS